MHRSTLSRVSSPQLGSQNQTFLQLLAHSVHRALGVQSPVQLRGCDELCAARRERSGRSGRPETTASGRRRECTLVIAPFLSPGCRRAGRDGADGAVPMRRRGRRTRRRGECRGARRTRERRTPLGRRCVDVHGESDEDELPGRLIQREGEVDARGGTRSLGNTARCGKLERAARRDSRSSLSPYDHLPPHFLVVCPRVRAAHLHLEAIVARDQTPPFARANLAIGVRSSLVGRGTANCAPVRRAQRYRCSVESGNWVLTIALDPFSADRVLPREPRCRWT